MQQELSPENIRATNRFTLVLLALAFIVPLLVAYVAYKNIGIPGKTKNHGDLIVPARPLPAFKFMQANGESYSLENLKGKWTLIYVSGPQCDAACEQALYKIRQSRLAQNEEIRRVQRLMIVVGKDATKSLEKILSTHQGMHAVFADAQRDKALLSKFDLDNKPKAVEANRVYISDPLGNLMMSYPDGFDPRGLIKDMQLLLKASQIG